MLSRSRCISTLTILAALSAVPGASAASRTTDTGSSRPTMSRPMAVSKTKGTGPVRPIATATTTVVAITAFPTGGKGSGTEATCGLWADQLQSDQNAQDEATDKQDVIDATNALNEDADNALDAGCAVIYSAVRPQSPAIRTVALAKAMTGGGFTQSTYTAGPQVAMISAFPTGGKGSGTEATCNLWSQRLQDDQQVVDDAPDTDKDDASGPLDQDIDNALDAGCAVIY